LQFHKILLNLIANAVAVRGVANAPVNSEAAWVTGGAILGGCIALYLEKKHPLNRNMLSPVFAQQASVVMTGAVIGSGVGEILYKLNNDGGLPNLVHELYNAVQMAVKMGN
jgi:hypothetical protein